MEQPKFEQTAESKADLKRTLENLKMEFLRNYPDKDLVQKLTIEVMVGQNHCSKRHQFMPGRERSAWLSQVAHIIDMLGPELEKASLAYPLRIWLDIQMEPPVAEAPAGF